VAGVAQRDQRVTFTQRVPRNWAAVLIIVIGSCALAFSLVYDLWPGSAVGGVVGVLQFLFEYFPGVLFVFVAMITFTYGTRQLASVTGKSRLGRALFVLWAVLSTASQVAFVGYLFGDPATFSRAQAIQEWCGFAAVAVGLVAAVFVFRARVVTGFAGIALFIAVITFGVTLFLIVTSRDASSSAWDLPRLGGVILLGIGYWRAGISTTHPPGHL
jgi:hypothetical protein